MVLRRAAAVLSMIGLLTAGQVATGAAAAAPAGKGEARVVSAYLTLEPPAEADVSRAGDVTTQSNCPITSTYGHAGEYICETTKVRAVWRRIDGSVIVDDIVIGTNYFIYTDPGDRWKKLDDGEASHFLPLNQIGLFLLTPTLLAVYGTNGDLYCIGITLTPHDYGSWDQC